MKKELFLFILPLPLLLLAPLFVQSINEKELETDKKTYNTVSVSELKTPSQEEKGIVQEEPKLTKKEELHLKLNEIKQNNKKEWYIEYRDLVCEYAEWCKPPQTIFDAFSEEEVNLICRVVETECFEQDFDSKCNVASVVLNRYYSREFGETITEVVTSPYQFSYGRKSLTEDTILAVMYVYEIEDTTDGCVAFRSGKTPKKWYDWNLAFVDESGHGFYK